MEIYLLNLTWVASCSILATLISKKYRNKELNEFGYVNPNRLFVFLAFISLFLVSALRWRVGTDYWQYESIFKAGASYTIQDIIIRSPEYLSALINWIIGIIFNDYRINFAVYSFITCYLFTKGIKDYSDNYWMSMILYIVTMNYYGAFNGVVQWAASSILFFGYRYLVKKDFKKYLITVLLATMFHSTALLGIPLYFLVNRKFKSKINLLIIAVFILCTLFFSEFLNNLFALIEDTDYGHYKDAWFSDGGREANPLRFIVSLIPVFLGFIYYKKIDGIRFDLDILLNLSLINALFNLLGTKNYIFIRFGIYLDIYNVLLIPVFIKMFKKNELPLIVYVILGCYFLYMYSLLPVDSNLLPYRTIFRIY